MTDITETEYKAWEDMTPEEQAAFTEEVNVKNFQRQYAEYHMIIEVIKDGYDTGLSDRALAEEVDSWIYGEREIAGDEKEQELKDDADTTAAEIASLHGWEEKAADEEDDEEL